MGNSLYKLKIAFISCNSASEYDSFLLLETSFVYILTKLFPPPKPTPQLEEKRTVSEHTRLSRDLFLGSAQRARVSNLQSSLSEPGVGGQ